MNFNSTIKTISISSEARKVYEKLEVIRPNHISFSLMLAIAADEYTKSHKKGVIRLDDFSPTEDSIITPNISSGIDTWIGFITSIGVEEFKEVQQKLTRIQNIVDERNGNNVY
jgi:predicted CopG family antitoxin